LTGVRFLAAFHVVLFHTLEWRYWSPGPMRMLASSGGAAVSFFFILSGFILTYTYARPGAPAIAIRPYYAARFARVYPVYALGLLVSAPLFIAEHVAAGKVPQMLVKAVTAATLTQSYVPRLVLAWNGPGWSLSAESFFYVLFPSMAVLVTKLTWRAALYWIVAIWLVIISVPLAYSVIQPDGLTKLEVWNFVFWANLVRYNPFVRLPEFVLGMLLGRIHTVQQREDFSLLRTRGFPEAVAIAIVLGLALRTEHQYLFIHNGGLAPLFCILILALSEGRGPLVRLLSCRPLLLLGEASYALYILHDPISHLVRRLVGDSALGWIGTWSFAAVIGLASIAVSLLTVKHFEEPMRKRLRSMLVQKQAPQDAKLIVARTVRSAPTDAELA
jgi:peptidoglycan/LPS O-acetylase OafA/YrhL